LRAAVEIVALAAACLAPARATTVRRALENARRLLYYGGVPAFLNRGFLSS